MANLAVGFLSAPLILSNYHKRVDVLKGFKSLIPTLWVINALKSQAILVMSPHFL